VYVIENVMPKTIRVISGLSIECIVYWARVVLSYWMFNPAIWTKNPFYITSVKDVWLCGFVSFICVKEFFPVKECKILFEYMYQDWFKNCMASDYGVIHGWLNRVIFGFYQLQGCLRLVIEHIAPNWRIYVHSLWEVQTYPTCKEGAYHLVVALVPVSVVKV
jgi:hypothetical protein